MTFRHTHILSIMRLARQSKPERAGSLHGGGDRTSGTAGKADGDGRYEYATWSVVTIQYLFRCHYNHYLEFLCSLLVYALAWPIDQATEFRAGWVTQVFIVNVLLGWTLNSFWHYLTYVGPAAAALQSRKFNPVNQYEPKGAPVRMFRSSTGHLEREIFLNTLGFVQSSTWQCVFMYLYANNVLPLYTHFWDTPAWSIILCCFVTFWREIHFYVIHRMIHPWRIQLPLVGDVGKWLYYNAHSYHHLSKNPGPWSGLSMHPIEHIFYYSCILWTCLLPVHPVHFLYTKCHADVSPIGGHGGHGQPAPGSDYHFLHHHKFECNYGVPFPVNFDKVFGTWMDWNEFRKTPQGVKLAASLDDD